MIVLAIDPGPEHSAFVWCNDGRIVSSGKRDNESMLKLLRDDRWGDDQLAIEMIASYGMPVGREVFETCIWIGRYLEAWSGTGGYTLVYRREVKIHLCGSMRANDATVRQALLDRFGPGREKAIGTKKAPGPLHGIHGDVWSALAVAVTYSDMKQAQS